MFASRGRLFTRSLVLAGTAAGVSSYTLKNHQAHADNNKKDSKHQKIVIVGGGTGGIGVAAQLRNAGMKDITIIDPASKHYYQPLWTLVGAGIKDKEDSVKEMKDVIPRGVNWVQKAVATFQPESNKVTLADGTEVNYDYLVVAGGLQINWNKIPGLIEGLEKTDSGVVSIYHYDYSEKTFKTFEKIKLHSKKMLFTVPIGLIKCAGAPQKIMWLLEDTLREQGLRHPKEIEFFVPGPAMFGIKHYADKLNVIREKRDVDAYYKHELVSIDVDKKIASFKNLEKNEIIEESYDLLHVTPPMSAPDFIKSSPFANADGWMEVNKHTLQSTKYPNVFGLGDCTNTPNSKTAAAITAQAPVLVHNLFETIDGKTNLTGYYNGYASCPLIISKKHVLLAEFGYDGKLMETFDAKTGKFPYNMIIGNLDNDLQQRFFYWLKEQVFPFAYWTLWTRGLWYGTNGPFKPDITKKPEN
jgi:sulfide:quinone oxidoreductase